LIAGITDHQRDALFRKRSAGRERNPQWDQQQQRADEIANPWQGIPPTSEPTPQVKHHYSDGTEWDVNRRGQ
jgi:hypothetical protein